MVAVAVPVMVQSVDKPDEVADERDATQRSPATVPGRAMSVEVTYSPLAAPDDATEPGFHVAVAQERLVTAVPPPTVSEFVETVEDTAATTVPFEVNCVADAPVKMLPNTAMSLANCGPPAKPAAPKLTEDMCEPMNIPATNPMTRIAIASKTCVVLVIGVDR